MTSRIDDMDLDFVAPVESETTQPDSIAYVDLRILRIA
jgi:hypothetical protein